MNDTTPSIPEHIPVLACEVVQCFEHADRPLRRIIDGTLGNGGHSKLLLERFPELQILGIDRDEAALERAATRLRTLANRITLCHGEYADMAAIAAAHQWSQIDGILLDIGVSSPQIDDPRRGFSWRQDGPLDMRMDRSAELTASRVVNFYPEAELARIFREYGELKSAKKLAAAITAHRATQPLSTTSELTTLITQTLGQTRPGTLPLPTLVFQALRIEVNRELDQLDRGLNAAEHLLAPGGLLAVITFHSLEDRAVKNFMRERARDCICPPGLPVCCCNHHASMKTVTRGVITAGETELSANRRAASAKLRVAEKI